MATLRLSTLRHALTTDPMHLLTRAPRAPTRLTLQRAHAPRSLHTRTAPLPRRAPAPSTRRFASSSPRPNPDPTPNLNSPPARSLSARLKQLSREYGWAAFGIYMALSALDFPFCFLAVRLVGTERIGELEHYVVGNAKRLVWEPLMKVLGRETAPAEEAPVVGVVGEGYADIGEVQEPPSRWGVREAQVEANKSEATLWTQLVLAYAIHKSFIFIRVPLTAAITPRVVKTLRGWGWNIGKRTPKA